MTEWTKVKWSEAGQITALLGWKAEDAARAASPAMFFKALKSDERFGDAVRFLGLALPRLETVAWAARTVRGSEPAAAPETPEGAALKATLLWLQDPVEGRRRAAFDAAQAADSGSAEAMAAMAAFYSGGSIAPADCEPLQAPRDAAGRFAAGAVLLAAARSADEAETLRSALDLGETLAIEGFKDAASR